jgi:hypothetical protein
MNCADAQYRPPRTMMKPPGTTTKTIPTTTRIGKQSSTGA